MYALTIIELTINYNYIFIHFRIEQVILDLEQIKERVSFGSSDVAMEIPKTSRTPPPALPR